MSKLGAIVLLLAWGAVPAMACLLPNAMLTTEENQCCREMAGQCGDMGMPASHSCCQKVVKPAQAVLKTPVPSIAVDSAWVVTVEEWVAAFDTQHDGQSVPPQFHSPPQSPPITIEILRV